MEEEWSVELIKDDFMFSDIQCISPQGSLTCPSKSDGIYDSIYSKGKNLIYCSLNILSIKKQKFLDNYKYHLTNSLRSTLNNCYYSNNVNYLDNINDNINGSPCSSSTQFSSSSSNCSPESLDLNNFQNLILQNKTDFLDHLKVSTTNSDENKTFTEFSNIQFEENRFNELSSSSLITNQVYFFKL